MTVDKIIIGAGLYGLYAAQKCGAAGQRVLVLERDPAPFMRATYINQARVHMGYHYPRSYSSASAGIMISACTQALTRSMPPAHISAGPMRPNSAASAPRPRSAAMMLPRSATLITVCAMAHF